MQGLGAYPRIVVLFFISGLVSESDSVSVCFLSVTSALNLQSFHLRNFFSY